MEGAGANEQHVVGLHRAVLGVDRRALDQRQQVALHALAAHVAAAAELAARRDLVDLVDEDDAVLLDRFAGLAHHALLVEQLVALLAQQRRMAVGHGHLALLGAAAEGLAQHVADIDHADRAAGLAGHFELHRRAGVRDLDLDLAVVELALAQLVAEAQARLLAGVGAAESIEHAILGRHLGLGADILAQALARHVDGGFHQVACDLLDVSADVAHFGELGRLDFQERRVGELGQAPRDLGLAAAGGSDHQDVLGQNLFAQSFRQLEATPAVAQRDGDRTLGVLLADDVLVEFGDDLTRRKIIAHGNQSFSMTRLWLV